MRAEAPITPALVTPSPPSQMEDFAEIAGIEIAIIDAKTEPARIPPAAPAQRRSVLPPGPGLELGVMKSDETVDPERMTASLNHVLLPRASSEECCEANHLAPQASGLVDLTFGNVSVADREAGRVRHQAERRGLRRFANRSKWSLIDFEGNPVEGDAPSALPTRRPIAACCRRFDERARHRAYPFARCRRLRPGRARHSVPRHHPCRLLLRRGARYARLDRGGNRRRLRMGNRQRHRGAVSRAIDPLRMPAPCWCAAMALLPGATSGRQGGRERPRPGDRQPKWLSAHPCISIPAPPPIWRRSCWTNTSTASTVAGCLLRPVGLEPPRNLFRAILSLALARYLHTFRRFGSGFILSNACKPSSLAIGIPTWIPSARPLATPG